MLALWRRHPLALAAVFVLTLTVWRIAALGLSDLDLFFDEAQYWFWAKHPALGYYSKPPVIAWLVAVSTALAGDTEFGVRLFMPLCYAVTAGLGAAVAGLVYDRRAAAWTAITLATLPAVSLSAGLASTDVPLLLCWAAALLCWFRYWREGGRWWIGFGLAFGAGLMSKYAMAYWLLCLPVALVLVPEMRGLLRRPGLWLGLGLGLLLFLPNVWWNATHELASFSHTADNAHWAGPTLKPGKLAEFAGAQFGVMGPILLLVFCWALVGWRRLRAEERVLAAFSFPVLVLMLAQALVSRAHANWAAVAYIAATVLVVGFLLRRGHARWLGLSFALHLVVAVAMMHGAAIAPALGFDPWSRLRGWRAMGAAVADRIAAMPGAMLTADDRAVIAELLFYVRPQPEWVKLRSGERASDHYELVSDPARIGDRPVLYVTRNTTPARLSGRFATVEPQPPVQRNRPTRGPETYRVYRLDGFEG
ncbi:MAG: glycosyltransferase family 39 protein [Alphaproteobacteria bacterium]|nr:glycosyltransferase family 39 protein [Alphaproteobacteria bacterium]MCB9928026.1 glycosyltransferase family 39 protein [Alphaproteobacteria bacterium]